jgi:tryptophan synthase
MGTTGSSAEVAMNIELPAIISRVRKYARVPLAVGFGVATRNHFMAVADAGSDGVVIGSRIVSVIKGAPHSEVSQRVEQFCRDITLDTAGHPRTTSKPSTPHVPGAVDGKTAAAPGDFLLPARFGQFGGQYVPESLVDCLAELEAAHQSAMNDPTFLEEFRSHYKYINRPSSLFFAERLTEHAGGARIWLKREDLWVYSLCPIHSLTYLSGTTQARTKLTMPLDKYFVFSSNYNSC